MENGKVHISGKVASIQLEGLKIVNSGKTEEAGGGGGGEVERTGTERRDREKGRKERETEEGKEDV